MKEFVSFIVQHWTSIAAILIGLINLLILLFKRKFKIVDSMWAIILSQIPHWICAIEKDGLSGAEKKEFVISYCLRKIEEFTDFSSDVVRSKYRDRVSDAIEDILACPQKKGA